MNTPTFTAEASLYKTSRQYWMTATNTSSGQVLPQGSFDECVRSDSICSLECSRRGNPSGCQDACNSGFLDCVRDLELIERSGCFRDRTSSTGWRLRECTTLPGASGQATQCSWSDECPAPGCGACTCTRAPDGARTCTQQCFTYSPMTGQDLTYTRSCVPPPRPGTQ